VQFLFKSTHHSWRYERKCEWVFFSEHSVHLDVGLLPRTPHSAVNGYKQPASFS